VPLLARKLERQSRADLDLPLAPRRELLDDWTTPKTESKVRVGLGGRQCTRIRDVVVASTYSRCIHVLKRVKKGLAEGSNLHDS